MRFSLFGREKMLHTSFRSAGFPLCIVCEYCRKNNDFQCILACGTRLATHSSAGSQPIRMRFSLFGREKMLHTSFRSAGIPLCIVCEYCRKNSDFRISNIEYETGRVWQPIAQLVLNRSGCGFRYLAEKKCCTRVSGQRVFRYVSSVSIVEKTAIFEYRI